MTTVSRNFRRILLAAAFGLSLSAYADKQGQHIEDTRHNFSAGGSGSGSIKATTEEGICIFCHVPHKSQSSLLLWNHDMSVSAFAWTGTTATTGGTTYPTNLTGWAGSSAKCLSCHDGTVSVGAIAWNDATNPAALAMTGGDVGKIDSSIYRITGGTSGGGGADLTGNHPVGVPFPLGNASASYNGITSGASAVTSGWVASPSGVKIFGAGGGGAPVAGAAGIECASCHNPHGTANSYFLRVSKDSSALCLACHDK